MDRKLQNDNTYFHLGIQVLIIGMSSVLIIALLVPSLDYFPCMTSVWGIGAILIGLDRWINTPPLRVGKDDIAVPIILIITIIYIIIGSIFLLTGELYYGMLLFIFSAGCIFIGAGLHIRSLNKSISSKRNEEITEDTKEKDWEIGINEVIMIIIAVLLTTVIAIVFL